MKNTDLFLSGMICLLLITGKGFTVAGQSGQQLFEQRCASCHALDKVLVGPALGHVDERRPMDWIIKFVHAPHTMIQGGDKAAAELYAKFNPVVMPDHPDLSDGDIRNIVDYIKSATRQLASAPGNPIKRPAMAMPAYRPLTGKDRWFFFSLGGFILVLIGVLVLAVDVKAYAKKQEASSD